MSGSARHRARRTTTTPRRPLSASSVASAVMTSLLLSVSVTGLATGLPKESALSTQSPATSGSPIRLGGGVAPGGDQMKPTGPGVIVTLSQGLEELDAAGQLDQVLSELGEAVAQAAQTCGTSITRIDAAGGGLVVYLESPEANACLVKGLRGAAHVLDAEEDLPVTGQ